MSWAAILHGLPRKSTSLVYPVSSPPSSLLKSILTQPASLPMLRPVIRKLLPNSLLTSHTSGNDNSGRHLQLLTITRSKESNAHAGISMPQLADAECGSFGIRPCGMQWPRGPQTTIWSAWKNRHSSDDDERLGPGIHARDEMVVHVEHLL